MKKVKEHLEVGDKIHIKSTFNSYTVTIERVTKTMAITNPLNDAGYCMRFKLKTFMGSPRPVGEDKWSTTRYTIIN